MPDKHVTLLDPAGELMPGFSPEMRKALRHQLDALGVELRLNTSLPEPPPTEPGTLAAFTAATTDGAISADIWFRCHGVRPNSDHLDGDLATTRTARGHVRVTGTLNVEGHDHVYAIGDLTDLNEAKMAGHAMRHAEVVAQNILAQVRGEPPTAIYRPSDIGSIVLPLGPNGGVGQIPSPGGPTVLPAPAVSERKGADLYTGRFARLFGTA